MALALGTVVAVVVRRRQQPTAQGVRTTAATTTRRSPVRAAALPVRRHLVETRDGLAPGVSDGSVICASGGRIVLLGGLTAADTSVDTVIAAGYRGARTIGRLPSARHDTAAAVLGGTSTCSAAATARRSSTRSSASIRHRAHDALVGRLPAPSSDSAAAAIGGTAYVVGGYTGTRWLDTIVAWRPGRHARVVAHLPQPLRYAAVTAVGGRLVIAGGSLANGTASDAVLAFTPGDRSRHAASARLPAPTTHARRRRSATSPT